MFGSNPNSTIYKELKMSRTIKGKKGCGYDFWSRRPPNSGVQGYGPFAKKVTHRKERRLNSRIVKKEFDIL